ncbi:MAG TPA: DUF3089 domain-containing protein [Acidimicrobiales bacterium]|nr:DUF3089 domain-containing protein [Acidimicrobiales bacterium]
MRRAAAAVLGAAVAAGLAVPTALAPVAAPAGAAGVAGTTAGKTVWLCRPQMADDPCTAPLTATVVPADGPDTVQRARPARHPAVDCFYVYPTVSEEQGINANLAVQPAETAVARAQASRFSQDCRVYAPMYRQVTVNGLLHTTQLTPAALAVAYSGVLAAWREYLARYNHGRGVVVIGHSQGAAMLIRLLRSQVDHDPKVRRRLVSAVILGGNVTVPVGRSVGGTFSHIPACRSTSQTGCVVAYSSFDQPPPADSLFGRPGTGVSLLSGQTATAGLQVLCVNPADPGGRGVLRPYFPSADASAGLGSQAAGAPQVSTPWVTYPDLYTARCRSAGGATWLAVTTVPGGDRPVVTESLGPTWGLHLVDVNIALGNLVTMVHDQVTAYERR